MICQHCRTEVPLTAEMAVRLKAVIVLLALLPWLEAATNSDDDRIASNDLRSMIGLGMRAMYMYINRDCFVMRAFPCMVQVYNDEEWVFIEQ